MTRGSWLFGVSMLCIGASLGLERFSHELCHSGFPLRTLTVMTPIAGMITGVWSIFHRSAAWIAALKVLAVLVNGYQFFLALVLLVGIGIAACG